ncbi:MAG: dihydrolipoyl dehydrogenase [Bacteroidetes bacterium]|jgi:dihydrolipoamide dehydrogenase|nr:dihydrolipoyl dehydrogenase [Bacteroidota bacterium]MBT6687380.1 dihydrolipoyl dehydrogenase [Bacteroidota bacterium]MBT7143931.1 dihydrolipoyl dehydrogenase [Bacteroidota bacterium]MBT7492435.1 dihydrolipoyl dehydrogenase [Bacteroidota bacterium]
MNFDLIVIGSGPGGYVAAIRASQLGMNVAVVERAELGGICLNWGCIPTKALLKSAQVYKNIIDAQNYGIEINGDISPNFSKIVERSRLVAEGMSKGIQFLFKKNKIEHLKGIGKIVEKGLVEVTNSEGNKTNFSAKNIILATGARSRQLPNLQQNGKSIIGYREALCLPKLPKSLIVVGSGAIGSEFAFFYSSLGTKVTLVEFLPNIVPFEDEEVSKNLGRSFKKSKIKVMTKSTVQSVEIVDDICKVSIETKKGIEIHEAEIVLSAVGISPNIENIGIEELDIKLENSKIKVDDFYQTNVEGIYAIGDIVHGQALAHVASAEGITCVEKIAGLDVEPIDYYNIPACTYTSPEVASVGLTEKMAIEKGYETKIGKFPFTASGKANAIGSRDGFVKLIFDAKTNQLLGGHMIGANVTEMISGLMLAKKMKMTAHEIIKSVHPHPTLSEAIMEAAAAAYDEVIHL